MKRREFLKGSVASGMLLGVRNSRSSEAGSGTAEPPSDGAGTDRPNIVIILTDDQGYWEMGAYGNPTIETPVMDQLARESVRFTYFYCSPLCAPTRSSLLTGRYYQRTGTFDTDGGYCALHPDEVTIAEVLQAQGYRTGIVGKWHLGFYMKYHPNEKGFQEFMGFYQDGMLHRYFDPDKELYYNKQPVQATGYATDIFTDQAIDFVNRNKKQPFFLYVPYAATHMPCKVPNEYLEKYIRKGLNDHDARIYATFDCTDGNIGRLLKAIDDNGLRERTVVILLGDNGGVSQHFKAGLRGMKSTVYEGGIRVPFLARWPGRFPVGTVVDAMAQHIDVLPTICEIVGAPLPAGRKIDGKSILPLLKKGKGESPHEYLYHQWTRVAPALVVPTPEQAARCRYSDQGPWPNWAIRDAAGHKLLAKTVGNPPRLKFELYDLKADPGEAHDLSSQFPDQVREFKEKFAEFFADVSAGQDYKQPPIQVGREDENPVHIDLNYRDTKIARLKVSTRHFNRDVINNWTQEGDTVTWPIEVVRPGRYAVTLAYGCPRRNAGSKLLVRVGNSQFQYVTQPTPGRYVYRTLEVGTLDLVEGKADFEIKAISIPARELFALHRIWLKRLEN